MQRGGMGEEDIRAVEAAYRESGQGNEKGGQAAARTRRHGTYAISIGMRGAR